MFEIIIREIIIGEWKETNDINGYFGLFGRTMKSFISDEGDQWWRNMSCVIPKYILGMES